jgi:hypothetical protein
MKVKSSSSKRSLFSWMSSALTRASTTVPSSRKCLMSREKIGDKSHPRHEILLRFLQPFFSQTGRLVQNCRSRIRKSKKSASHAYLASCITIAELYEIMNRRVGRDVVRLRIASIKIAELNSFQLMKKFLSLQEILN